MQPETPFLDRFLNDIDKDELSHISRVCFSIEYLSNAQTFPSVFPVKGRIYGPNHRAMINLACQYQKQEGKDPPALNITFIIDSTSPNTYLSKHAIEALCPKLAGLEDVVFVRIQTKVPIQCTVSPMNSHFANVNILGMDFLIYNSLKFLIDCEEKLVLLSKKD